MKKILVVTRARGFLYTLFSQQFNEFEFVYDTKNKFENHSKIRLFLASFAKSFIGDILGYVPIIKYEKEEGDNLFSYNRFVDTTKDYHIYLENPLAIVAYSTERTKFLLARNKVKKHLNAPNLKTIVCLSKACYDTIKNFYDIPSEVNIEQIYPLVLENPNVNESIIIRKNKKKERPINCLYISANFNLKGGREIFEAIKKINKKNSKNFNFRIITNIDRIDDEILKSLNNMKNVELNDFSYNREELEFIYSESDVLLNPSRQDSFSLVTLEAMKAGLVILTTNLYALKELVIENNNGFLISPKYQIFDDNNMPDKFIWNNRRNTIHKNFIDTKIVDFLVEKLNLLNNDRDELCRLQLNSFKRATTGEFNSETIKKQWKELLGD